MPQPTVTISVRNLEGPGSILVPEAGYPYLNSFVVFLSSSRQIQGILSYISHDRLFLHSF